MRKIILFIFVALLISCTESDRQKASKIFVDAENFYAEKNFYAAKIAIDSIHARFPRMVEYRRKADTLLWKITLAEILHELSLVDSALISNLAQAEMIFAENYNFQKDERFQQVGDYEHIAMATGANAGKNYLKPITDEKGNFRFVSTLVGQKINHRAVEATCGELSAQTLPAADADCNSYNDIGTNYETVLFNAENAKDFILFLQDNVDNAVKITLLGDKNFSYNLSKKDVKIFVETYYFSLVLKNIAENQAKKTEMEKIKFYLTEKIR
ncbi:MAG: hypothetical protein LBB53_04765 [Prevotellaceae bacterium]|jgi:hypothetical protein|nr:hypothetical protein [Prevotellaceae bacterium]